MKSWCVIFPNALISEKKCQVHSRVKAEAAINYFTLREMSTAPNERQRESAQRTETQCNTPTTHTAYNCVLCPFSAVWRFWVEPKRFS